MSGTAEQQRTLWGKRASDFAELQERMCEPLYRAAFARLEVGTGTRLLDVGCGAGGAARIAAGLGARVSGIDATPELIAIAGTRTPAGEFRVGEMEELPYADAMFDCATGFNSFQYAASPVQALTAARRVIKKDGHVVIATWGKAEDCEATAHLRAIGKLLPPPPAGAPGPFALSEDGALEALASKAGLAPVAVEDVDCPFSYPNLENAVNALISPGPLVKAMLAVGEERVRQVTEEVLAPFRLASGAYRLENKFRFLVARA